jgi:predicted dehydrogenase
LGIEELKSVGVLGVEPRTSRVVGQLAPFLNPPAGMPRQTGMVITHVWDKDRRVAEEFARRFGIPNVADRFDGMAGKVAGVFQCGYMASYWSLELVRPYLEAGAVVFVDRPGAYSIARARRMLELAARSNAVVYWGNLHESHPAIRLMSLRAGLLAPLAGVTADCLTDPHSRFYSLHGVHGIYMLCAVLPGTIRRVRSFFTREAVFSPVSVLECENPDGSAFTALVHRQGVDPVGHEGIEPASEPRERAPHRGWLKIYGRNGAREEAVRPPVGYSHGGLSVSVPGEIAAYFSLPALAEFERVLVTRKPPQAPELLLGKLRVFLASWTSLVEQGAAVGIAGLSDEWTGPNPYPAYFPEGYFPAGG